MNKSIPNVVKLEFQSLIDMYGDRVELVGHRDGVQYYNFAFPEDVDVGFPQIVGYSKGKVIVFEGFEAVELASSFSEED